MDNRRALARAMALAVLNDKLTWQGSRDRCAILFGRWWPWVTPLVKRLTLHFGQGIRPRASRVALFILGDAGFSRAWKKHGAAILFGEALAPRMRPASGRPKKWRPPPILTPGDLAARLNLGQGELAWFSDPRMLERALPPGPLRHYHYLWRKKSDGSARLIESPKQRLKAIQRNIPAEILSRIPAHDAAHGFRACRSVKSFTAPHVGRAMVLKLDLKDFFPTVSKARVAAIFRTAGYPEGVADILAGLCLNTTPSSVLDACPDHPAGASDAAFKALYRRPHLPQGAPTSPALANLAAYRLDCRLGGLALAAGAEYTRYADDLVFSGGQDFARMHKRFLAKVREIALAEGFQVHPGKTRAMKTSTRQSAAGVILNQRQNIPRETFDRLKAILHNCAVHGPESQNRDKVSDFAAHFLGHIAHVTMLNPGRGQKLRREFDRIRW